MKRNDMDVIALDQFRTEVGSAVRKNADHVLPHNDMLESGLSAEEIINKKGLQQIDDVETITKIVDEVISENQQQVEKYKAGNERLFGFFIGQTLKKMNGKANPAIVNDIVGKKLKNV